MSFSPKIAFLVAACSLGLCANVFCAEELTITTYYPSPYGSYSNLYVAGNLGIGTTAAATNNNKLEISIGSTDGTSKPLVIGKGSTNYLVMLNNGNLGIGVTNPGATLDVGGDIDAPNLTRDSCAWTSLGSGSVTCSEGYFAAGIDIDYGGTQHRVYCCRL